jgi:hypothetical protein
MALSAVVATAQTPGTALAVDTIVASGAEADDGTGPGLSEMIVTDLVIQLGEDPAFADCDAVVVEWRRRQDILDEQALQQSGAVDPATAVETGNLIEPTRMVGGGIKAEGGRLDWTIEVRSHPDGAVQASFAGSAAADQYLRISQEIARQILEDACRRRWTASGGGAQITISGGVAALDRPFSLTGEFPGGIALFRYVPAGPGGGSVTYTLEGSGVSGSGEGSFTMTPRGDGGVLLRQTTSGCIDGLPNSCRTNTEEITLTPVAP